MGHEHEEKLTEKQTALRFWIAIGGIVSLVSAFFWYGGPEKLTPPECTLTIHAALGPSQDSETLHVEVRKSGGFGWLHNRLITSGTLELNGTKKQGKLELKLPGSGNVIYIVKSSTRVTVQGTLATGTTQESEQSLRVKGNTDLYLIHHAPDNPAVNAQNPRFTFRGTLSAERPSGTDSFARLTLAQNATPVGFRPGNQPARKCLVVLTSPIPTPAEPQSVIFVDGVKVQVWPAGARQAQVEVAQGKREIRIVAGGKILVYGTVVNAVGSRMEIKLPGGK